MKQTSFLRQEAKAKMIYKGMLWSQVLSQVICFLESGKDQLTEAVLLRVLEYYDGILILTTNRMKSFDVAVQSRIREFFSGLYKLSAR